MPEPEKNKHELKSVEFKFIFNDDYNPVFANGAFGGVGPHGDLVINFYHERAGLPHSQTHSVETDDKVLGPEISRDPPIDETVKLVRFVTTGVVMDEACARRIYSWLGTKLQQFDSLKKGK